MKKNEYPLLFTDEMPPILIMPKNKKFFSIDELFDIVEVESDDLQRLPVYGGAIYCDFYDPDRKLNMSACSFWYDNAAHLHVNGINGKAIFVPEKHDPYRGYDTEI